MTLVLEPQQLLTREPELLVEPPPTEPRFTFESLPPLPHPLRKPLAALKWLLDVVFGLASLFLYLSILAAIPVGNVLALGYLLEAQGRVARTGRLTHAFPLLPLAPRFGGIALGMWIWLFGLRFLAEMAADAQIIAPDGAIARNWSLALQLVSVLVAAHLCLALARGGALSCFFRPIKNARWFWQQCHSGQYWRTAEAAVSDFVGSLKLRYHFWLGLRGYLVMFAWLVIPTAMFSAFRDADKPGQLLVTLLGALLLIPVLSWAPFLQAHFAAHNSWKAAFDRRLIRELFRRRPVVLCVTSVLVYALALPLYLMKAFSPPRDGLWMMTIFFIPLIYPAKILVGWVYYAAMNKPSRAFLAWRWLWFAALVPVLALYVFILFFTPAIGQNGRLVLFQHHALMLPTPF